MNEQLVDSRNWQQDSKGRFVSGNIGGGRPKGSRNKLGEAMIADLFEHWKKNGMEAIRRVFDEDPTSYLKIVAILVSKMEDKDPRMLNAVNVAAVEEVIKQRRLEAIQKIEEMNGN